MRNRSLKTSQTRALNTQWGREVIAYTTDVDSLHYFLGVALTIIILIIKCSKYLISTSNLISYRSCLAGKYKLILLPYTILTHFDPGNKHYHILADHPVFSQVPPIPLLWYILSQWLNKGRVEIFDNPSLTKSASIVGLCFHAHRDINLCFNFDCRFQTICSWNRANSRLCEQRCQVNHGPQKLDLRVHGSTWWRELNHCLF